MQSGAFYITGGTLKHGAASYIVRSADEILFRALSAGEFAYILTSRQMGKSSLMVRTASSLREAGIRPVVLDLTAIGQNLTVEQWYGGLLERLGRQLGLEDDLEDYWDLHLQKSPMQRFNGALLEAVLGAIKSRIVIFVDEIDAVRSLPFKTDEFFASIRELYTRRATEPEFERLTFCLLGVATPSDLIRDTRATPFNIGKRVVLEDFTPAEAAPLAAGLGRSPKLASELLDRVLFWTGGHPYLTQRLCQAVAEDPGVEHPVDVDRLSAELFTSPRARQQDDNILFVRDRILRAEEDLPSLLDVYQKVRRGKRIADDEASPLLAILKLSGLLTPRGGFLRVRNRIYAAAFDEQWIVKSMPDAELRRQKEAFRRGVVLSVLLASVIISLLLALALFAVDRGRRAENERLRAEASEEKFRQLLYSAQMNLAFEALYAGQTARLAGLLDEQRPKPGEKDRRGWEWYHLWSRIHNARRVLRSDSPGSWVGFSPHGKEFGLIDGNRIRILDSHTLSVRRTFVLDGLPGRAAFSPDGRILAVVKARKSSSVTVFDLHGTAAPRVLEGRHGLTTAVTFLPDGRLVTNSGTCLLVWDPMSGQELHSWKAHKNGSFFVLTPSPSGRILASAGADSTIRLWDTATWEPLEVIEPGTGWIHSVRFSPRMDVLFATSTRLLLALDWKSHRELQRVEAHKTLIWYLDGPTNGNLLVTASNDSTVKLWRTPGLSLAALLPDHLGDAAAAAFSPDGKMLVTASSDETFRIWDVEKELARASRSGPEADTVEFLLPEGGRILRGRFSKDARLFALALNDGSVHVYSAETGKKLFSRVLASDFLGGAGFSPDGTRLAVAGGEGCIHVLEMPDGKEVMKIPGHKGAVYLVEYSPDGKWLISTGADEGYAPQGGDRTVRFWDAETGAQRLAIPDSGDRPNALAFTRDLAVLLISDTAGRVRRWDLGKNRPLPDLDRIEGPASLAVSSDGRYLSINGRGVVLWDLEKEKRMGSIDGIAAPYAGFLPGGRRLVTFQAAEESLRLWDVQHLQETGVLRGHQKGLFDATVVPGTQDLRTLGRDGTIRRWRSVPADEAARAEALERKW